MKYLNQKKITSFLILIIFLSLLFSFQNCGKDVDFETEKTIDSSSLLEPQNIQEPLNEDAIGILINNGDFYTTSNRVSLQLTAPNATKVFLSESKDCSGQGSWKPMSNTTQKILTQPNGKAYLSAKFSYPDKTFSECVNDSIIFDDHLEIKITNSHEIPSNPTFETSFTVKFEVIEFTSGIEYIKCKSTQSFSFVDCRDSFTVNNLNPGQHSITINAKDFAGNTRSKTASITVLDTKPGSFYIRGISGTEDKKIDRALAIDNPAIPHVYWTQSKNASFYDVGIYSSNKQNLICQIQRTQNLDLSFSDSCALTHGLYYQAFVSATNNDTGEKLDQWFQFIVDNQGPEVKITDPPQHAKDFSDVTFNFTIKDNESSIGDAGCTLTRPDGSKSNQNCTNTRQATYTRLTNGQHVFEVVAYDEWGNRGSDFFEWNNEVISCDPCLGIIWGCEVPECQFDSNGKPINELCSIFVDSFERDKIHEDAGAFNWDLAITDTGGSGELVEAEIHDFQHLGPIYHNNSAILFTGRPGSSVHEVYLVSKPFDLSEYDYAMVRTRFVPLSLDTKKVVPQSRVSVHEGIRVDVCKDSNYNCGLEGSDQHVRIRDFKPWTQYYFDDPYEFGQGLNIRDYQTSDWKTKEAVILLDEYQNRKQNFVFKISVVMDEGYLNPDNKSTSLLEDGLILDFVEFIIIKTDQLKCIE